MGYCTRLEQLGKPVASCTKLSFHTPSPPTLPWRAPTLRLSPNLSLNKNNKHFVENFCWTVEKKLPSFWCSRHRDWETLPASQCWIFKGGSCGGRDFCGEKNFGDRLMRWTHNYCWVHNSRQQLGYQSIVTSTKSWGRFWLGENQISSISSHYVEITRKKHQVVILLHGCCSCY